MRLLSVDVRQKADELQKFRIPQQEEIASYYVIRQALANLRAGIHGYITKPHHIVPFLQAGRLVHVCWIAGTKENWKFD